jgi:SAM-dependent methyltransferase
MQDFTTLVDEAWNAPFSGWDFAYLKDRYIDHPVDWDYTQMAVERLRAAQAALDMDTGGGELFSSMAPFPALTCATEAYAPNVPIARARLEPMGVRVEQVYEGQPLPFADQQFDLVLNRHGYYDPREVMRILRPGGRLLTQQVGGRNHMRVNEMLQDAPIHPYAHWTLASAKDELTRAGFDIFNAAEAFPAVQFMDIGALVYFLKAISWQVVDFSPETHRAKLAQIDTIIRREGHFTSFEHRFLLEARKPA